MTGHLPDEYDDLVSAARLLAEIADDPDARADSRIRAVVEWRNTIAAISQRIADEARREQSWHSKSLRSV
jgi:hypothetical protein